MRRDIQLKVTGFEIAKSRPHVFLLAIISRDGEERKLYDENDKNKSDE